MGILSPFRRHIFARCAGITSPLRRPFPLLDGGFVPISLMYVKETGTPKENIAKGGCSPLQTPALRAPMYVMDKASEVMLCVLREVRIITSQSYSQPCMSVERRSMSVQCTHCVRQGVSRGNAPLDALFFGKIIFPKTQPSVVVAFLRGDAAE